MMSIQYPDFEPVELGAALVLLAQACQEFVAVFAGSEQSVRSLSLMDDYLSVVRHQSYPHQLDHQALHP